MDIYSLQRLARSEHELMVQSLPKVYDFAYPTLPEQSLWSRWMAGLRSLAGHMRTSPQRTRPSLSLSNPSLYLRDQLREDSNHELDWLWAASQVAAAEEIRYCLERALYINPDNHETQRALSKLVTRHAADEKQAVNRPGFAQASDH